MICKYSVENFKAFATKVELDFFANGNIKRFDYNYIKADRKNILKTIGFYGPNNTGKTCILLSLVGLKALMLNEPHADFSNSFSDNGDLTSFEVEYYINGRYYSYSVSYNNKTRKYEKEKLIRKFYKNNSLSKEDIFERNANELTWNGIASNFKKINVLKLFSFSLPFMVLFDDKENKVFAEAKKDYIDFANSLVFLKMDGPIDISQTINLMKTDPKGAKFVKEFVKNCDLHINDFGFDDTVLSDANIEEELKDAMIDPSFPKESLKLYSTHNGHRVPSVFFDSAGTQKLIALSGYIYESLKKEATLIIDEIDSSLHHILTKSIVAMFNNMLNKKSQLLFTTHDVLLLDLKEMFRKDQIWLVDVLDRCSSKINRLSEFTSRGENGIRGDEDVVEHYLKGRFGSIPTPDLFASLEEATSDE